MSKRSHRISRLQDGSVVAFVPLGPNGKHGECAIDLEDLSALVERGVSMSWTLNFGSQGVGYVYTKGAKNNRNISIARLIMDCRPGEKIRYRDGNSLNLRRENLKLVSGFSCKSDELFV